jgi:hypothetical protein
VATVALAGVLVGGLTAAGAVGGLPGVLDDSPESTTTTEVTVPESTTSTTETTLAPPTVPAPPTRVIDVPGIGQVVVLDGPVPTVVSVTALPGFTFQPDDDPSEPGGSTSRPSTRTVSSGCGSVTGDWSGPVAVPVTRATTLPATTTRVSTTAVGVGAVVPTTVPHRVARRRVALRRAARRRARPRAAGPAAADRTTRVPTTPAAVGVGAATTRVPTTPVGVGEATTPTRTTGATTTEWRRGGRLAP